MTEQQRQQRAAFIQEQPYLWLFMLYASAFVGCAAASDVLHWASGVSVSRGQVYVMPVVIIWPMWLGLRGWARRVSPPKDSPSPSATASEAGHKPVGA